ncbi:melibiose:sodium transporter MelB, partial [Shigella dysenteriae]
MPIYLLPLLFCKDFENLKFCEGVNLGNDSNLLIVFYVQIMPD